MSDQENSGRAADQTSLKSSSRIAIAELSHQVSASANRSVSAVVTLIWPYSTSSNALTVLLAEPDFRLRRNRGQVRVQFTGSSARAVAKARIASGDEVQLSLEGVRWVQKEATVSTPGKTVDCEALFRDRLILQIHRDGQQDQLIDVNHPTAPSEGPIDGQAIPRSPTPPSTYSTTATRLESSQISVQWSSPAFSKRARVTSGLLFRSTDELSEEADEAFESVGRKRLKFGRESGGWRYADRSPSPEKKRAVHEKVQVSHGTVDVLEPQSTAEATFHTAATNAISGLGVSEDESELQYTQASTSDQHPTQLSSLGQGNDTPFQSNNHSMTSNTIENGSKAANDGRPGMEDLSSPPEATSSPFNATISPQSQPPATGLDVPTGTDAEQHLDSAMVTASAERSPPRSPELLPVPSSSLPLMSQFAGQRLDGIDRNDALGELLQISPCGPQQPLILSSREESEPDSQEKLLPDDKVDVEVLDRKVSIRTGIGKAQEVIDLAEESNIKENPLQGSSVEDEEPAPRPNSLPDANGDHFEETPGREANLPKAEVTYPLLPPMSPPYPAYEQSKTSLPWPTEPEVHATVTEHESSSPAGQMRTPEPTQPTSLSMEPTFHHSDLPQCHTVDKQSSPGVDSGSPKSSAHVIAHTPEAEDTAPDAPGPHTEYRITPVSGRVALQIRPWFGPQRSIDSLSQASTGEDRPESDQDRNTSEEDERGVIEAEITIEDSQPDPAPPSPEINAAPAVEEPAPEVVQTPEAAETATSTLKLGLRTAHAYFTPLAALPESYNTTLDVLAIATHSSRVLHAATGARDFYLTLRILDPSSEPDTFTSVQIFRPFREALPHVEPGDGLLLRAFKVTSSKRKASLLSTEESAWVVWQRAGGTEEVKGPPVEYGEAERQRVVGLQAWWDNLSQATKLKV